MAIMSGMYAAYQGQKGIANIAMRINRITAVLKQEIQN
jgi:glycine cleavage system pyridoxal-binding protein P